MICKLSIHAVNKYFNRVNFILLFNYCLKNKKNIYFFIKIKITLICKIHNLVKNAKCSSNTQSQDLLILNK